MQAHRSITLPSNHLPARVTKIRVVQGDTVDVDHILFGYSHVVTKKSESNENVQEEVFEEFRSPAEGQIQQVFIKSGQTIQDASFSVITILEPCSHAVQLHGLCALCGKDLAISGGTDVARATIPMDHTLLGLLVAPDEAQRIEKINTERLLKSKKLSLILDLDQTVIHATVDPTVGEWMADPDNPNFPALKDVHSFGLPEAPGTMYYVKLRPHLKPFLEKLNELYEMHIYTMGTRSYANEVARAMDPDGKLFGERILSRDESGSFSHKSLARLFPYDQNMVVVVDDRGDVWNWTPNLIKVRPYDFFVGIGDINAPVYEGKRQEKPAKMPKIEPKREPTPPDEALNQKLLVEMQETQMHELDEVVKKRPLAELAKLELQLEEKEAAQIIEQGENQRIVEDADEEPPSPNIEHRRPILYDTDSDLPKLQEALEQLHRVFYQALEKNNEADVRVILPKLKAQVLEGTHIVFSSIIPMGTDPRQHPDYILATSFGAQMLSDVSPKVTHVVATRVGTAKVNAARRISHAWIVEKEWLHDSVYQWERKDEEAYILIKTHAQEQARESSSEPLPKPDRLKRRASISILQQLQQVSQQLSDEESEGAMEKGPMSAVPTDDGLDEEPEDSNADMNLDFDDMDQEVEEAMAEDSDSDDSEDSDDPPLDEDELDAEIFGLEHPGHKRKRSVDSPQRGEKKSRVNGPSVRQRMTDQILISQPTAAHKERGMISPIERLPSPPHVEVKDVDSELEDVGYADTDSDSGMPDRKLRPNRKPGKETFTPLDSQADLEALATELEAEFEEFEDEEL